MPKQKHKILIGAAVLLVILFLFLIQSVFSVKTIEVTEGELISLKLTAIDEDGDPLIYTFQPPLNESGQWQTQWGDAGEYDVDISVSDGLLESTQQLHITVKKANRPPVLPSFEDMVVNEGDLVTITPQAIDEEGEILKYSISDPISDDFTWQTGYDDSGEYNILVTVSDSMHTVSKSFKLIVNNVNRDPSITSFSPTDETLEIKEGESIKFSVAAEDEDNEDILYEWYLDDDKVSESGNYKYITDFNSAGEHSVSVEVSDKETTLRREWTVNVLDQNRAPVIEPIDDITINEGELVSLELSADDPDGDELYYKAGEPLGNDLEWQTGYGDAGEYENNIEVSDGKIAVAQIVNIIVNNVNRAPLFKKINDIYVNEGEKATLTLKAEDPDKDKVTFSASQLPDGAYMQGDTIVYSPGYDTLYKKFGLTLRILKFLHLDKKVYPKSKEIALQVNASDGIASVQQEFKFIVADINQKPVLGEMNDITISETDSLELKPSGLDPDNDRIKFYYSWPFDKKGEWETSYNDSGVYTASITVSDGLLEDTKSFKIIVNNKNRMPLFNEMDTFEASENHTISIVPLVTDPDGDKVELSLAEAPKGAKLVNGTFTWTPGFDFVPSNGSISVPVSFVAFDGTDYVKYSAMVNVKDTNRIPILTEATPAKKVVNAYVNEPVYFSGIAADYDSDALSYRWKFGIMDWVQGAPVLKRTFTEPGNKEVKLIVSDGKDSITKTWAVNVVERPLDEPVKKPITGTKLRYVIDNKNAQSASLGGKKTYIIDNKDVPSTVSAEKVEVNTAASDQGLSGDAVTFAID